MLPCPAVCPTTGFLILGYVLYVQKGPGTPWDRRRVLGGMPHPTLLFSGVSRYLSYVATTRGSELPIRTLARIILSGFWDQAIVQGDFGGRGVRRLELEGMFHLVGALCYPA